jgi:hypothetical protein
MVLPEYEGMSLLRDGGIMVLPEYEIAPLPGGVETVPLRCYLCMRVCLY